MNMNIILLNKNFEEVRVIDVYESFIWTDRYYEAGDFELVLPLAHFPKEMQNGTYLTIPHSEHVMIVEDISLVREAESGSKVTVTGRSLESILDRRVIYEFSYLKGDFKTAIRNLLNNSIIQAQEGSRRIANFVYEDTDDPYILATTNVDAQYFGVSLYETIVALCKHYRIGFRITLSDAGEFVFKLYHGDDNSLEDSNTTGNFVVFSEDFGNLIKTEYFESTKDYKNAAFIGGEGEGVNKVCAETDLHDVPHLAPSIPSPKGLERREIYVDASDTTSKYIEKDPETGEEVETPMKPDEYEAVLKSAGQNELFNHSVTRSLNGEIETLKQFKYGEDFKLGDVVQIETAFAESTRSRVIEVTFSDSTSGFEIYQTLQSINIGDYGEV